jgi:hypothetical protein
MMAEPMEHRGQKTGDLQGGEGSWAGRMSNHSRLHVRFIRLQPRLPIVSHDDACSRLVACRAVD